MNPVQIKICRITTVDDACACADAGVEMIGLNFYRGSARCISVDTAREIVGAITPRVDPVGIFVDPAVDEVFDIALRTGIRVVQLHGDVSVTTCQALAREFRVIRAVSTHAQFRPEEVDIWRDCDLLVDAHHPEFRGGTGFTCDWAAARASRSVTRFLILSGGLNEHNVAKAIGAVSPHAVDVCSGVETSPGVKDQQAIKRFVAAVRHFQNGAAQK